MQTTLYLLVGYPGAGKTTASKLISELTGAKHLWADEIRKEKFKSPTYSLDENTELYDAMNRQTANLLQAGQSVVFDTNFNFADDRQKLRDIATQAGARTLLLWVKAPVETAKQRATRASQNDQSRVLGNMTEEDFSRITSHLEEPTAAENPIILDGTDLTKQAISSVLV